MTLSVASINPQVFKGKRIILHENEERNPISKAGETSLIAKATFLGGLALGARLLWELYDNSFLFEHAAKKASKIVEKNNKGASDFKKFALKAGAFAGIIIAGITGFALLYTLFNTPKIAYKSKLNTYKKGKEMDVYIGANKAERELYAQINEKAQNADEDERQYLKEQYAKMRIAKNRVPDFVKIH